MKNRRTLSRKLIGSYLLLILVTTVLLSALVSQLLSDHFYRFKEDELIGRGLRLSELLAEEVVERGSLDSIDREMLRAIYPLVKSMFVVVDKQGRIVGDPSPSRNRIADREFPAGSQLLSKALEGETVSLRDNDPRSGLKSLIVGVPIRGRQQVEGAVFLFTPVAEVQPLIDEMLRLIRWAALGVGLLALFLGYFLSQTITKPLRKVTEAVREVSSGRLDVRVEARTNDEVGELATTFNQMAEALKETVEVLSYEKDRMKQMLADMAEGVIAVNQNKAILLMNDKLEAMFGLSERDLLGRSIGEVEILRDVEQVIDMAISDQSARSIPSHIEKGDQTIIVHASPLGIRGGTLGGAIVVIQDITDLERVERLRQQVVANVSHELRTPLTVIRGYAEALEDGVLETAEAQRAYLAIIREEADRLNRLVSDLLDLSKIQSGQAQLRTSGLSLYDAVERALANLEAKAREKGITTQNDVPTDLPMVKADRDRLTQVLVNLINNGIRFTEPGGWVRVSAEPMENHLKICVEDNGIGIPEDHLSRVWERFHKVDSARSPNDSGTGLGLSIVKSIVEAHGGTVWVERNLGVGSTFIFTLPIFCPAD